MLATSSLVLCVGTGIQKERGALFVQRNRLGGEREKKLGEIA